MAKGGENPPSNGQAIIKRRDGRMTDICVTRKRVRPVRGRINSQPKHGWVQWPTNLVHETKLSRHTQFKPAAAAAEGCSCRHWTTKSSILFLEAYVPKPVTGPSYFHKINGIGTRTRKEQEKYDKASISQQKNHWTWLAAPQGWAKATWLAGLGVTASILRVKHVNWPWRQQWIKYIFVLCSFLCTAAGQLHYRFCMVQKSAHIQSTTCSTV